MHHLRTGLAYLGNGSGAVMPIEPMVNFFKNFVYFRSFSLIYDGQNLSCRTSVTRWWMETLEQMELVITFNI
jgi:hypothetical protein